MKLQHNKPMQCVVRSGESHRRSIFLRKSNQNKIIVDIQKISQQNRCRPTNTEIIICWHAGLRSCTCLKWQFADECAAWGVLLLPAAALQWKHTHSSFRLPPHHLASWKYLKRIEWVAQPRPNQLWELKNRERGKFFCLNVTVNTFLPELRSVTTQ